MSTDLIEFLNIKKQFTEFLENKKENLYKYREYYLNYINNSESIEEEIEQQLVMIILFIRKETTTCRGHHTGELLKQQSDLEYNIITNSCKILTKFKDSKINDINNILMIEKHKTYNNNIQYGIKYDINFELITFINITNLQPIFENLYVISRLRNLNNEIVDDNLEQTLRYLNCYYYSLKF
jgi:hypothetical protein